MVLLCTHLSGCSHYCRGSKSRLHLSELGEDTGFLYWYLMIFYSFVGQPIIVSNVSKQMKVNELWSPDAFSREFGHVRHDLIDCRRNEPLTGYQIKCFWDGFEDASSELTLHVLLSAAHHWAEGRQSVTQHRYSIINLSKLHRFHTLIIVVTCNLIDSNVTRYPGQLSLDDRSLFTHVN